MNTELPPPPEVTENKNFEHDCDGCTYLGSDDDHDYYHCGQSGLGATVIARFSSEGPDYASGLEIAKFVEKEGRHGHPLAKALRLARARKLPGTV